MIKEPGDGCSNNMKIYKTDYCLAFLFAVVTIAGYSYELFDSCLLLSMASPIYVLSMIFLIFGLMLSSTVLIRVLSDKLHQRELPLPSLWQKHPFAFPFVVILCVYFPVLLIKYPAAFEYDAYHQIMSVKGEYPLTQHWPVASTYFFSLLYNLGVTITGSTNKGIFMVVVIQVLICDACLAYSIYVQKKLGVKNTWKILTLFVYCIMTIYSRYITSLVKDALYSCFVLLFVSQITLTLFQKNYRNETRKPDIVVLGIMGLLVSLFRNNGKYIISFLAVYSLLVFLQLRDKMFKLITVMMIFVLLFQAGFNYLVTLAGIPQGSIKEALSIPFQQTARYIVTYPDQVTVKEADAIALVLDYELIPRRYDPKLSDPVKKTFHANTNAEIIRYFTDAWFPQLLKHPIVYIEATFNNTIEGFFCPLSKERTSSVYMNVNYDAMVHYFDEVDCLGDIKNHYIHYVEWFESFPIFYPFCNCALQMWICIAIVVHVCTREKSKIAIVIPSIVGILVCIASPTFTHNGLRYALPIIYCNLFLGSVIGDHADINYLYQKLT